MQSGWDLLKLIEDVLDLSQLETGVIDETKQPCDVNKIIENCINQLQPNASVKKI